MDKRIKWGIEQAAKTGKRKERKVYCNRRKSAGNKYWSGMRRSLPWHVSRVFDSRRSDNRWNCQTPSLWRLSREPRTKNQKLADRQMERWGIQSKFKRRFSRRIYWTFNSTGKNHTFRTVWALAKFKTYIYIMRNN